MALVRDRSRRSLVAHEFQLCYRFAHVIRVPRGRVGIFSRSNQGLGRRFKKRKIWNGAAFEVLHVNVRKEEMHGCMSGGGPPQHGRLEHRYLACQQSGFLICCNIAMWVRPPHRPHVVIPSRHCCCHVSKAGKRDDQRSNTHGSCRERHRIWWMSALRTRAGRVVSISALTSPLAWVRFSAADSQKLPPAYMYASNYPNLTR